MEQGELIEDQTPYQAVHHPSAVAEKAIAKDRQRSSDSDRPSGQQKH